MQGALLGLGLKNIFGLFLLFMFFIVLIKVLSLKWDKTPKAVQEFIAVI